MSGTSNACVRCGESDPAQFYTSCKTNKCKPCIRQLNKERYYARTPEVIEYQKIAREEWKENNRAYLAQCLRESYLQRTFGLTQADYERMLETQEGKCFLCGTTEPYRSKTKNFCVDHCHVSGRIRALLCGRCNVSVGHFEKLLDLVGLEALLEYVQFIDLEIPAENI